MITLIQTLQILVSLAFVAYVLMAALGVVLIVKHVQFPPWSERIMRRLAGPRGDAEAGV